MKTGQLIDFNARRFNDAHVHAWASSIDWPPARFGSPADLKAALFALDAFDFSDLFSAGGSAHTGNVNHAESLVQLDGVRDG